jgi:hypothetical protein
MELKADQHPISDEFQSTISTNSLMIEQKSGLNQGCKQIQSKILDAEVGLCCSFC